MRSHHCPRCRQLLLFEHEQCSNCGLTVAFDIGSLEVQPSDAADSCANRQLIGCNWSAEKGYSLCRSCNLTRTIPNLDSAKNVVLWKRAEQAKKRLVYDICRLDLPFASTDGTRIAFDILAEDVAGKPVATGHAAGLITLNLAEADDVERETRRVAFREPYRTLPGHFRHESGHFYWAPLVLETELIAPFRVIFGDERQDYETALKSYHERADRSYDRTAYISEYATSHPWEDWAETFAHFLHIVSAIDSAAGLPLSLDPRSRQTLQNPYQEDDFEALLLCWRPFAYSINELNRALGQTDAYPFELSRAAIGKLHFVHMAVTTFRERRRKIASGTARES